MILSRKKFEPGKDVKRSVHPRDRQGIILLIVLCIGLVLIVFPWLTGAIEQGGFLGHPLHAAKTASYQTDLQTKIIPMIEVGIIKEALQDQGVSEDAASQIQTLFMVTPTPTFFITSTRWVTTSTSLAIVATIPSDDEESTTTSIIEASPSLTPSLTSWWPGGNRTRIAPTATSIPIPSPTYTRIPSLTATRTYTTTLTPSPTFTTTLTSTSTVTQTLTMTHTAVITPSATASLTPSQSLTPSPIPTDTPTAGFTLTPTQTFTEEPSMTTTFTPTNTLEGLSPIYLFKSSEGAPDGGRSFWMDWLFSHRKKSGEELMAVVQYILIR